jgi:hypothetical protein
MSSFIWHQIGICIQDVPLENCEHMKTELLIKEMVLTCHRSYVTVNLIHGQRPKGGANAIVNESFSLSNLEKY